MYPLGGHIIIGLPGSLPDETSIPETPLPSLSLLPILLDWTSVMVARTRVPSRTGQCTSLWVFLIYPLMLRAREATISRLTIVVIPNIKGDMALLLYTCSS